MYSVSFSVGTTLKKGDFLSFAPSFSGGYAWTDTIGEISNIMATCPEGGMRCGLRVIQKMCQAKGRAKVVWEYPEENASYCTGQPNMPDAAEVDYQVDSPCLMGDSMNKNMVTVTDVSTSSLRFLSHIPRILHWNRRLPYADLTPPI